MTSNFICVSIHRRFYWPFINFCIDNFRFSQIFYGLLLVFWIPARVLASNSALAPVWYGNMDIGYSGSGATSAHCFSTHKEILHRFDVALAAAKAELEKVQWQVALLKEYSYTFSYVWKSCKGRSRSKSLVCHLDPAGGNWNSHLIKMHLRLSLIWFFFIWLTILP